MLSLSSPGLYLVPEVVSGPDVDAGLHVVADSQSDALHPRLPGPGVKAQPDLRALVLGAAEANHEVRVKRLSLASEVSEAEAEWVTRAGLGPHLVTVTRLASAYEYDMHV